MTTTQKTSLIALMTIVLVLNPTIVFAHQDNNNHEAHVSTQGNSYSNPDGGGVDKPYQADNQPAKSQGNDDYDGNNGCGNDIDHEDDNKGNCLGLKKHNV